MRSGISWTPNLPLIINRSIRKDAILGLYTALETLSRPDIKLAFNERAAKYTEALGKIRNEIYNPGMSIVTDFSKE